MPTFSVKLTDEQFDSLAVKAARAGVSRSDVARWALEQYEEDLDDEIAVVPLPSRRLGERDAALRRALRFMPDWALLSAGMGEELAERRLLEHLDPPLPAMKLAKVDVGQVIVRGDALFVLATKSFEGKLFCGLRPLSGERKIVRAEPGEWITLPHRLDVRLPPEYLDLTTLEEKAVAALSQGSLDLRQLYVEINARRGRDSRRMRPSRNELAVLCGKLLLGLVTYDLATYSDGDPLASLWKLTPRGHEAAKHVTIEEEPYYDARQ